MYDQEPVFYIYRSTFKVIFMYFKRVFRLMWQLFNQIVPPPWPLTPSSRGGGHRRPGPPPCIRAWTSPPRRFSEMLQVTNKENEKI